jgi:hypothetical protein
MAFATAGYVKKELWSPERLRFPWSFEKRALK